MAAIVRRGDELRKVVRQRRRMRWLLLVGTSVNVALFAAMVWRRPDGLFIATLCVGLFTLLVGLVTFIPRLELRALRNEITRPPLTRAQGKRWAYGGLLVGAGAIAVALILGAITGAWLGPLAVALPIALMSAIWAAVLLCTVRGSHAEP